MPKGSPKAAPIDQRCAALIRGKYETKPCQRKAIVFTEHPEVRFCRLHARHVPEGRVALAVLNGSSVDARD